MASSSLGLNTEYTVQKNPLDNNKIVVSTKREGIDQVDIAQKLMEAKKALLETDTNKISKDSQKLTALSQLRTKLDNFDLANKPLRNYLGTDLTEKNIFHDELSNFSPINGENASAFISASVAPGKNLIGNAYNVQVKQIAKNDLLRSDPAISNPSAALGASGSLVINGTAIIIAVTDSLYDIIDKVNNETSVTNVKSSSAAASATADVFWLTASELATPINLNGTDAGILTALNLPATYADPLQITTRTQALQSKIAVDGYDFYRNTNAIDDIIDGVTLNSKAVMSSSSTLSFALNIDAIINATIDWIEAFNDIKTFLAPHLLKPTDDDPNGEHVLFQENIVEQTLRMLNQARLGVDGLFGGFSNINGIGIALKKPEDMASILTYDPVNLPKLISENPSEFLSLMGQNFTSTNVKTDIVQIPDSLNTRFANTNLILTISNVTINGSGQQIFDATLANGDGSYTETILGTTSLMEFTDVKKFKGFSIQYNGTVPPGGDTSTFSVTQGVASRMDKKLEDFLLVPLDVDELEKHAVLNANDDKVERGTLSSAMYKLLKEKKSIQKKVDDANKRAEIDDEKNIKALNRHSAIADKAKQANDLINQMYNKK